MFATKDAYRYKNIMLQKRVTRGFAGNITRPVFLCLQMKQHDLVFPTGENGKTIIFIFCSFVLDCIVVVILPLSCLQCLERHLEQRTPSFCTSVFCALAKSLTLNTYFSCLTFLFPNLQSSQHAFVNIYTAHKKLTVLWCE